MSLQMFSGVSNVTLACRRRPESHPWLRSSAGVFGRAMRRNSKADVPPRKPHARLPQLGKRLSYLTQQP